jgi:hypothetical protein
LIKDMGHGRAVIMARVSFGRRNLVSGHWVDCFAALAVTVFKIKGKDGVDLDYANLQIVFSLIITFIMVNNFRMQAVIATL